MLAEFLSTVNPLAVVVGELVKLYLLFIESPNVVVHLASALVLPARFRNQSAGTRKESPMLVEQNAELCQ